MKKHLFYAAIFCSLFSARIAAQTHFKTPRQAADALYAAWRTKNRKQAKTAADTRAIEKLFSANFIARRKFQSCADESETERGLFTCVYEDPTDNLLNVAFETVKRGKYWRVRFVTFAAEN